jgi:lysophospholipase L1-like esterase
MKVSNPIKAVVIIVLVLLTVSFYESKRVGVSSVTIENPLFRSLSLAYAAKAESIKSFLGLNSFFNQEESFWQSLKELPESLIYKQEMVPGLVSSHESPSPFLTINPPYNILIVGDSFIAESFGPVLERELLSFQDVQVFRKGVYSTGFSRPDYFNWEDEINKLISEKRPNLAFVMFGANDGQDQTSLDGKVIHYGDKEWNPEYGRRIARFLEILQDHQIFAFWIGNPIARDKYYADKMANLNSVYESVCLKHPNCFYLDTWSVLATSEGEYSAYLPDENGQKHLARASDGIHTTAFGSQILLKEIMNGIKAKINLQKIEQAE